MNRDILFRMALDYQTRAYAPYSGFCVGAALYTADDRYFGGCNIESVSYGATNCAERVAIQKAISEGAGKILAIAVVGSQSFTYPCGICRQVMGELAPEAQVFILDGKGGFQEATVEALFPHGFQKEDLLGSL